MEVEEPKKQKKKRLKFFIVIAIVLILVGALIGLFIHILKGPATGTVINLNSTPSSAPEKTLTSSYLTANYPGRYEPAQTGGSPSASLKAWTLVAHQQIGIGEGAKLSVVITNLPQGGVTEDSAYKLYSAYPDQYKLTKTLFGKDNGFTVKKSDSAYQQTILWPHKKYLLTVSLTASAENDMVDGEMQTLINSVAWAQ